MNKLKTFLKKYISLILFVFLILVLWKPGAPSFRNSSNSSYKEQGMASYEYDASYAQPMPSEKGVLMDNAVTQTEQKVIRTGALDLHVENVQASVEKLTTKTEELGGTVMDSGLWKGNSAYTASLTVRIPADQFTAAMEAYKDMALIVKSESTNAEDVTADYLDLEARLSNYEAEEAQYVTILTGAGTMTEVLEVTRALSDVRYNIETIQGQLNYYDSRVDFSRIVLSLSEDSSISAVSAKWRPVSTLKNAFKDWVVFLQSIADDLIYVAIFGWPLLIIFFLWWIKRKRR